MRLLIVGSIGGEIGVASKIALDRGAKVAHASDTDAALASLRQGQGAELVMVDVEFDIARFIASLRSERINVPVVACGVGTDSDTAVRAIKAGAREFIPLPPEAELIAAVLAAVTEESHQIIHRDPVTRELLRLAERVADSDASMLITGESGTGKELLARFVHRQSRRAKRSFVSVNCAAIPDALLESELFGHEKGAFTGAVARRIGKFEQAHRGTLLLDEIGEMEPRLQAKLLRVTQENEIDRVGGAAPIKIDIRLIATSNRDLDAAAATGTFREDLLFRLNVVHLHVSPLRERPGDIAPLYQHFIKKYAVANGLPERPLAPAAHDALLRHVWRGNVRELENAMHRAVLLAEGDEIGIEALSLGTGGAASEAADAAQAAQAATGLVGLTVAEVERDLILGTLNHTLGNRTHAATILGISIRTLRNKLRQYAGEGVKVPLPGEVLSAAV